MGGLKDTTKISAAILKAAAERGTEKSTCPSEIARLLFPDNWRSRMGDVLATAIDLQKSGKVVITQKGSAVDIDHLKGPVRIKKV